MRRTGTLVLSLGAAAMAAAAWLSSGVAFDRSAATAAPRPEPAAAAKEKNRQAFQARKVLNCTLGANPKCTAKFKKVGAKKRMEVRFVSCFVLGKPPVVAFLGIDDALSESSFRHALIWETRSSGSTETVIVSQPVEMTVKAGERAVVGVPFTDDLQVSGECSIAGDIVTLA